MFFRWLVAYLYSYSVFFVEEITRRCFISDHAKDRPTRDTGWDAQVCWDPLPDFIFSQDRFRSLNLDDKEITTT